MAATGTDPTTTDPPATYDSDWDRFAAWLGILKERTSPDPHDDESDLIRWGVISDLHIPFHDMDAIVDCVQWFKKVDVSRIVIAGDTMDCYSLSRFLQYDPVPIQEEFRQGRLVMDYLAREFSQVLIVEGNHEARERKYLAGRLPPDLVSWFLQSSILARLVADMANVKLLAQTIHGTDMGWLTQIGRDCIIGHPESQSTIPLRPVTNFQGWLNNWGEMLDLTRPRLVLAGHTHSAGMTWIGSRMVVESGCLCKLQSYALTPRCYSKPQRLACVAFDQTNGDTDLDSVRLHFPFANRTYREVA